MAKKITLSSEAEEELLAALGPKLQPGKSPKSAFQETFDTLKDSGFFARHGFSPADHDKLYGVLMVGSAAQELTSPYKIKTVRADVLPPKPEAKILNNPETCLEYLNDCCIGNLSRVDLALKYDIPLALVKAVFDALIYPNSHSVIMGRFVTDTTKTVATNKGLYYRISPTGFETLYGMIQHSPNSQKFQLLKKWIDTIHEERRGAAKTGADTFGYLIHIKYRPRFLEFGSTTTPEEHIHHREGLARLNMPDITDASIPSALGMTPDQIIPPRPSGRARPVGDAASHAYGSGKRR